MNDKPAVTEQSAGIAPVPTETTPALYGHLLAMFTIIIWGTTLISSKILLNHFSPIQILAYRFVIAYFALLVLYPKVHKPKNLREELYFMLAGLTGVTSYMLCQNIALTYSFASNLGLILCVAPLFTAGLFSLLGKEKVSPTYYVGFVVAITGIFLVMFNGSVVLKLNPRGDFFGIVAALSWAFYTLTLKTVLTFNYPIIYTNRKIFFYGLLTMLPCMLLMGFKVELASLKDMGVLLNMLYLGVGASAVCFITWAKATDIIGGVKTSAYIYLSPVVTIIVAAIVLKEVITPISVAGCGLILTGLYISDRKPKKQKEVVLQAE